ncbi:MAG: ABC transporter ATP-binding protein [Desulfobacterales bacterium]|nr:ABC transporter ATP-binding protein [Desulfobacterales bacterium]
MAIELRDVSFVYARTDAGVFNVSMTVGDGELMAVIGASGSGKTTLLKLVAGIITPRSGKVLIDGRDVTDLSIPKRKLGIVFQSYALFPHMSVGENVAYPLKVRKEAPVERRRKAAEALAQVGLSGFEDRQPMTLSGGQQQRVALARALVFQPRALLLDEPLSALDAGLRSEMRDEIQRLQRERHIATIHITHDQEEALSMADRIAVMESGNLVQLATPRTLYDFPATRNVAAFVGQSNLWEAQVESDRTIRLSFGSLQTAPHDLPAGIRTTALVRPEKIAIGPATNGINTIEGRLTRDRFFGSVRRFDLSVGDAVILGETDFRGDIETIHIQPEHIQLLPQ